MKFRGLGDRGQALFEYVFLLAIVAMIITGVLFRFHSGFRIFATSLFVGEDSYLACLIKNGVLPGEQASQFGCDVPTFKFQKGNAPPTTSIALGPTKSNMLDLRGTNRFEGINQKETKQPVDLRGGGGGRGRINEGAGGGIPLGSKDLAYNGVGGGALGKETKGAAYTGSTKISSALSGDASAQKEIGALRGQKVFEESGAVVGTRAQAPTSIPLNERDMKTAKEIEAEKKKRKIAEQELDVWDIGRILRIFIILALAFSIIFFVGAQVFAVLRGQRR